MGSYKTGRDIKTNAMILLYRKINKENFNLKPLAQIINGTSNIRILLRPLTFLNNAPIISHHYDSFTL